MQVFWSSATSTNRGDPPLLLFNITLKSVPGPCKNNLGAGAALTKVCNAKKRGDMSFSGTPSEALFKYDVTAPGCETPLDPYIVFR